MERRGCNVYRTIGTIFLVLGLVLLAAAGAARYFGARHLMASTATDGTIVDMGDNTTTIVYRAEGREYRIMLHEYDSSRRVGEHIPVYYDPVDPAAVSTGLAPRILGFVFSIMGGFLTVSGAVFLSVQAAAERRHRALLENGRRVRAQVVDVRVNYLVSVGMRHPVQLVCRPMVGDGENTFLSGNLWLAAGQAEGKTVNVYVDRDDSRKYYVDTSRFGGEDDR